MLPHYWKIFVEESASVAADYTVQCNSRPMQEIRIGVPENAFRDSDDAAADAIELAALESALQFMREAGAEAIDPADYPDYDKFLTTSPQLRTLVLYADWKADSARYSRPYSKINNTFAR